MTNSIQSNVTNTYIKSKFVTDPSPTPKTTVADTEPQKARSLETPAVVYSSSLSAGIAYRDSGHPNFDLSASSYAKFFGDGSSEGSISLALGVVDPAAETLSQGKAFHEVVQAARASLNAGNERVREQGGGQG
ncbi:hypothetical protein K1718_00125 [Roseibium porphyridii]|uniref:Uncharacterized protein n=1 Tax=Roseibium porphyridii TaxID=2866279 RepID=A0ABY8F2T7_9HYPH|nr:hypothetical protein [Roseibium sp. KMA01]WFE89803.1 hypothetical protein K1718_00125 [Roseibium sp. KMA01]